MQQYINRVKTFFTGQTPEEKAQETSSEAAEQPSSSASQAEGFATKRTVAVPRQPILQNAGYAAGRVQGLDWYRARLKQDKDGDLADEFLLEPSTLNTRSLPDKPLKVQHRNIRDAALMDADLCVLDGEVIVLPAESRKRRYT